LPIAHSRRPSRERVRSLAGFSLAQSPTCPLPSVIIAVTSQVEPPGGTRSSARTHGGQRGQEPRAEPGSLPGGTWRRRAPAEVHRSLTVSPSLRPPRAYASGNPVPPCCDALMALPSRMAISREPEHQSPSTAVTVMVASVAVATGAYARVPSPRSVLFSEFQTGPKSLPTPKF